MNKITKANFKKLVLVLTLTFSNDSRYEYISICSYRCH